MAQLEQQLVAIDERVSGVGDKLDLVIDSQHKTLALMAELREKIDGHERLDDYRFDVLTGRANRNDSDLRALREGIHKADQSASQLALKFADDKIGEAKQQVVIQKAEAHNWLRTLLPVVVAIVMTGLTVFVTVYLALKR